MKKDLHFFLTLHTNIEKKTFGTLHEIKAQTIDNSNVTVMKTKETL